MEKRQQDLWWAGAPAPEGLLQSLSSVSPSQYAKTLLPLTIAFLLGFLLEYRAEVGAERARLLTHETAVVQEGVRRLERGLEIATSDLSFVVDLVGAAIDDDMSEHFAALERSTLAFLHHRPSYFQIRFIGATGYEILRVETTPGGLRITPKSELQDKSQRDYFSATMRLGPGEMFVSPMEANVEHGVIDDPYKPVVRLATPIDDAAGQRRGIVILNAHAEHFSGVVERDTGEPGIQRMLVNSEDYWIQYRPEAVFDLARERGRSFQRTFPEIWTQLKANPRRWIEDAEGLFYSDSVTPLAILSNPDGKAQELPTWRSISFVPRRLLDDMAIQIATPLLVMAAPAYFVLLAIGCLMASARHRRRMAREAVRSLEGLERAMITAALDAIVVMDEHGITLEFNPSAQRIFGYTLEEARGKLVADLIIPPAYRETHRLALEHFLETGEGAIIDKHVDEITGIRKSGEEFPVELTVCPIMVMGKQFFYGFLRDLSESGRREVQAVKADLRGGT
jgi:PAS domain S-box-containing protein